MPKGIFDFPRRGVDPLLGYTVTVSADDASIMGEGLELALEKMLDKRASMSDGGEIREINKRKRTAVLTFTAGLNNRPPVFFKGDIQSIHGRIQRALEGHMGKDVPVEFTDYVYETFTQGTFGGTRPLTESPLEYTVFIPGELEGDSLKRVTQSGVSDLREVRSTTATETVSNIKVQIELENNRISGSSVKEIREAVLNKYIGEPTDTGVVKIASPNRKIENYSFRAN